MAAGDSLLRYWLGRRVAVVIDRPIGSRQSRHADIVSRVTYGYIPNTQAGGLGPVDACVLGVAVPVSSFIGAVITILTRRDDIEDALVVAPPGTALTRDEIREAVRFRERSFDSDIVM